MTASRAGFHIPSLDGLRALSFGLVFFAHAGMPIGIPFPGGFGVTVFFFLSGYLITTLLRLEYEKRGEVSFRNFYLRRALRILPPFYLVLMGALVTHLLLDPPDAIDWGGVLAQMLHYANYWIVNHSFDGLPYGTGVYWSLAVEEHFYLLFPLVFVGLMQSRLAANRQALALSAMCVLLLLWRITLCLQMDMQDDMSQLRLEIASDTRFDSILFGCILALYGNPALDPTRLGERLWKYVLLPMGISGLLLSFLLRDEFFRGTFRYTLQGTCLIPVFVCAVRYPTWLPMRPLNFRPLAFVGVLSYSSYLVHQVVIAATGRVFAEVGGVAGGVLALAITLAIAGAIYVMVEKPCARLRHKLRA